MIEVTINESSNYSIFIDFLIKIAAPVTIILIFIIERVLNSKEKKKNIDNEWYLNVIIYPNIPKINKFFELYITSLIERFESFNKAFEEDLKITELKTLKAKEFQTIRRIKGQFDQEFLILVLVYNQNLGMNLRNLILGMEEDVINSLDLIDEVRDQNYLDSIIKIIKDKKVAFHSVLYDNIKK